MEDFRPPKSHIGEEKKILVKRLVEEEKKTKTTVEEEVSRKQNFTRTILCPAASSSRGLSSLKDFTAILARQVERSELQKAGLTSSEQDLYFQFRENSSFVLSQSFKDKLSVINEKIQDYFKDDVQEKGELKRPMDEISKVEKELFDDIQDVPSLRKRRKMMLKEERKLAKVLSTVISGDIPASVRSSKSKWDQR